MMMAEIDIKVGPIGGRRRRLCAIRAHPFHRALGGDWIELRARDFSSGAGARRRAGGRLRLRPRRSPRRGARSCA